MKLNYLGIFQTLKLRILMGKILLIFSWAEFHTKYFGLLLVNTENTELKAVEEPCMITAGDLQNTSLNLNNLRNRNTVTATISFFS